jgi:hypothetical protein
MLKTKEKSASVGAGADKADVKSLETSLTSSKNITLLLYHKKRKNQAYLKKIFEKSFGEAVTDIERTFDE